jgi:hypothetical protein
LASDVEVRVVDELDVGGSDQAVIDEVNLPIEGYDALAASQIVARLGGLSAAELEQVQRYETAHRGRRTILHRTGQLLSGR